MSPVPLRPGEGQFPSDQIRIPVAPRRRESLDQGVLRASHTVPVTESYKQTVLRLWPSGASEPAFDVVPDPEADHVEPSSVIKSASGPVYFVPGTHAFGRLTTREDDADTLAQLQWRLDYDEWDWSPAAATSPDRQWVEKGALVRNVDPEEVCYTAFRHGQAVILRWDDDGLAPVPTRANVDVGDTTPVPVRLVPALTGCPLRRGADGVCKMYGGPWTSGAMEAALMWQNHRRLLLDAFGCDVCEGDGGGGARGAVGLFTPSRIGGWQWGLPRSSVED